MAKIRKGDTVQVISGKDKGLTGTVLIVYRERDKVLVEGVNQVKRHTKVGQSARGAKTGGIVTQEAPIHVSNVMLVDPSSKRPTRVGFRKESQDKARRDGTTYQVQRNVRFAKRSGEDI
jgi:large subunit ribosomal protein L24